MSASPQPNPTPMPSTTPLPTTIPKNSNKTARTRDTGPSPTLSATRSPQAHRPAMVEDHLAHVRAHLTRLRDGQTLIPDPTTVYLAREDGDYIWELIGVRLTGHPAPILGAVPFRRHDFPAVPMARESLASYLSAPSTPPPDGQPSGPRRWLTMLLPRAGEAIPSFLRGLRGGRTVAPIHLDPAMIEVAFDFRVHNPYAMDAPRRSAGALRKRLFRTARGHLLSGASHDPVDGPQRNMGFVAIKEPVQHTVRGQMALPSLVLSQRCIAVTMDVGEETTRLAAQHWVPFAPASASSSHLLLGGSVS